MAHISHDLLELPSLGKLYKTGEDRLKVAYLNGEDEDIITSPNLMQSGKVLEELINSKILNANIKYKDLIPQDRDAILIWLRITAYGPEYSFTTEDPYTGQVFEAKIDLSTVKTSNLTIDPDENGEFEIKMPSLEKNINIKESISGSVVKVRLLTIGDEERLEKEAADAAKMKLKKYNDLPSRKLAYQVMEIDTVRDRSVIESMIKQIQMSERVHLRKKINEILPSLTLDTEVEGPSGATFRTTASIGFEFIYPFLSI